MTFSQNGSQVYKSQIKRACKVWQRNANVDSIDALFQALAPHLQLPREPKRFQAEATWADLDKALQMFIENRNAILLSSTVYPRVKEVSEILGAAAAAVRWDARWDTPPYWNEVAERVVVALDRQELRP